MVMIRSNLFHLATAHPPSKLALTVAKPAAVVLSGQLRALSVNPKRTHDVPVVSTDENKGETKPVSSPQEQEKTASPPLSLAEAVWRDRMQRTPAFFRPFSSGFDEIFNSDPFFAPFHRGRSFDPFADMMPVLKKDLGAETTSLLRSSPGYEIKESTGTYQIAIDVPEGIKASDMKVELEQDGSVLHLTGERKTEKNNRVVHTRFDKHFSIGPNIDVEQLSANLDDGVLVVKAPKIHVDDEPPASSKQIHISEKPHDMTDDEIMQKTFGDAFDESDFAEAGKKAADKKGQ